MPDDREPFFTPDERKALAALRPREWRGWWKSEPLITKVLVGVLVALCAYGLYTVNRGDAALGWFLVALVGGLVLVLFIHATLIRVTVASVRWALRATGVTAWWKRAGNSVLAFGKSVLWITVAVVVFTRALPYLSTDPARTWYAMTQAVPVARVTVKREPHDCEFATAPLGSKHCHYDAKITVLEGPDTPDGKKSLVVTYDKVED